VLEGGYYSWVEWHRVTPTLSPHKLPFHQRESCTLPFVLLCVTRLDLCKTADFDMGGAFVKSPSSASASKSKKKYKSLSECKIWCSLNDSTFIYPELQELKEFNDKSELGIALSGGSAPTAAAFAIGAIRGLYQLGILKKARYISANSSSSCIVGPQAFYGDDLTQLLGDYLPPERCDLLNLKKIGPNSQTYLVCRSQSLKTLYRGLVNGSVRRNEADPRGLWSQAVGQIFFKHYGLNIFDHVPVVSGSHQDSVHRKSGISTRKMDFYDLTQYPFPIINACSIVRGEHMFAPVEFTPLYYGFPTTYKTQRGNAASETGGYLIEPFGFLAHPSAATVQEVKIQIKTEGENNVNNIVPLSGPGESHHIAEICKPHQFVSISDQVGMSSFPPSLALAHDTNSQNLDVTLSPIWNPIKGETNPMIFCDSAGIDSTGIHALLRRRVKKIFAMIVMNQSLMNPKIDHQNYSQSNFAAVAALFGVMRSDQEMTPFGISVESSNKMCHVFPSEDFEKLLEGLKAQCSEGKPCSFLLNTRVIPNPHVNIPGDDDVEILFILNAPSNDWIDSLPPNTKKKVVKQINDRDLSVRDAGDHEEVSTPSNNDEKEEDGKAILSRANIFLNQLPDRFEEDLIELRNTLINIFGNSDFSDFPFVSSSITGSDNNTAAGAGAGADDDYSVQCVNLMSQLMTWEVIESRRFFDDLLRL
jgi:hypothetical protein